MDEAKSISSREIPSMAEVLRLAVADCEYVNLESEANKPSSVLRISANRPLSEL